MPKIIFDQSPRFEKQCKKFLNKHPTFIKDLEKAKRLISKHFDEDDPYFFPDTVLCIDTHIVYRTVFKLRKLTVDGLRHGQFPRVWMRLHNNEIIIHGSLKICRDSRFRHNSLELHYLSLNNHAQ